MMSISEGMMMVMLRSYLITTSGGCLDCINRHSVKTVTEKVSIRYSNGVC
jgi:hypothetical protein